MTELTVSTRLQASAPKEPPFFSLLVPAYNAASTLDTALKSAEKTQRAPLEILVIDDGSNDATAAIAANHAERDERVRVITKENGGYGQAMNLGLSAATGDYIAILEADDCLVDGALDELFSFILAQRKAGSATAPDIIKATYWRMFKGVGGFKPTDRKATDTGRAGKAAINTEPANRVLADTGSTDIGTTDKQAARKAGFLCSYAHLAHTGDALNRKQIATLLSSHPSIWSAVYQRAFLNEHNIRFTEAPGAAWVDGPFAVATLLAAKKVVFFDKPLYCYFEDNATASSAQDISAFAPERFAEMMAYKKDIASYDVDAKRALTVVGLNYVERIINSDAVVKPEIAKKVKNLVELLDEDDIVAVPQISPGVKRAALHLKGLPAPRISSLPYANYLLRRSFLEMKNNGPRFVWHQLQTLRTRRAVSTQEGSKHSANQGNASSTSSTQGLTRKSASQQGVFRQAGAKSNIVPKHVAKQESEGNA